MDFAFSEEQELLRQSARSFLGDKFDEKRLVELAESDDGWDPGSWSAIAELGWIGLSVPEDLGGAGMGFLEEAVVFEELGRALFPGPYFATVGLALEALHANPDALGEVLAGRSRATLAWAEAGTETLAVLEDLGTKAEQTNGSWTLTGEKDLVCDLAACDLVVVVASSPNGVGLWLVRTDDESVKTATHPTMDSTRRLGRLTLNGTPAEILAEGEDALRLIEGIRRRAHAALALEAVGVAQHALDLAIAHAKERVQFDKPIGTYQAVSHPIADSYIATELARSITYWAAWCVAENDPQADVAAAAAKASAGEAAVFACERSIQVHGGIGFTWEHVLHRYYKRAQWIESFDGFGAAQRAAIATQLLDD